MISEEQYDVIVKDERVNVENLSASLGFLHQEPLSVRWERKEILQAVAIIILFRKSKGRKADVKAWVALLLMLFSFLNSRDDNKQMSAKSIETELYNRIKVLEKERETKS